MLLHSTLPVAKWMKMWLQRRVDMMKFKQLLYYWRYLFELELYARYDCRVTNPNTQCNLFPIQLFVCAYTCNSKTLGWYVDVLHIEWMLYSERSFFCVRAGCKIWLASYGFKHTLQSLSDTPFVPTYIHNLQATGHIWTFDCSIIWDIRWVV